MRCPNGHEVVPPHLFCKQCGEQARWRRCANGHLLDRVDRYCPDCGERVALKGSEGREDAGRARAIAERSHGSIAGSPRDTEQPVAASPGQHPHEVAVDTYATGGPRVDSAPPSNGRHQGQRDVTAPDVPAARHSSRGDRDNYLPSREPRRPKRAILGIATALSAVLAAGVAIQLWRPSDTSSEQGALSSPSLSAPVDGDVGPSHLGEPSSSAPGEPPQPALTPSGGPGASAEDVDPSAADAATAKSWLGAVIGLETLNNGGGSRSFAATPTGRQAYTAFRDYLAAHAERARLTAANDTAVDIRASCSGAFCRVDLEPVYDAQPYLHLQAVDLSYKVIGSSPSSGWEDGQLLDGKWACVTRDHRITEVPGNEQGFPPFMLVKGEAVRVSSDESIMQSYRTFTSRVVPAVLIGGPEPSTSPKAAHKWCQSRVN